MRLNAAPCGDAEGFIHTVNTQQHYSRSTQRGHAKQSEPVLWFLFSVIVFQHLRSAFDLNNVTSWFKKERKDFRQQHSQISHWLSSWCTQESAEISWWNPVTTDTFARFLSCVRRVGWNARLHCSYKANYTVTWKCVAVNKADAPSTSDNHREITNHASCNAQLQWSPEPDSSPLWGHFVDSASAEL